MQNTDGALDIFNLKKTIKAELQEEMKNFTNTINAHLQKELKNVFDSPEFRRRINDITKHQVGTWMGATDTRLNVIDNHIGRVRTLSQAQLATINNRTEPEVHVRVSTFTACVGSERSINTAIKR
jgi:hypothetical protein